MRSSILAVLLLVNIIFAGNVLFEDFESEDFLSNNWVHSGDADWIIDSVITYNGDFSACSGDIGNNSTTVLILDSIFISENNESKISFYKKISTEISYDYFKFYINDNVIDSCSGNIDWSYNEYYFNTTGNHTFKFEYIKDISDDGGSDQVWLDNITINEFIQAPAFSIPEGSYSNDMVLELTSIYENANIYYTNNGTDPDSTSIPYDPASGIEVSGDSGYVTIKAVLYNIAGENSLVAANTYYMGSELSGSISGNVGKGDYYVMGDLLVEDQTTLTIEPGVKMYFTGCYGIDVQGQIIAEGTKDDSITFTYKNSENEDGWGIHNLSLNALCGIYINGTTDISKFEYCKIEKTQNVAISTRSSILSIKNCLVSSFENGVVGFNNSGELDILNSTIINCKGLGVKAYFGCELSLIGNVISHNEGGLLIGASNSYVTNNTIANNYIATGFSNSVSGIIVSSNTVVTNDFTNNLIYNNETTGSISQIWVDGTNCHPNFRHNNIEGGRSGIIGSASINIYENNLDIDPKFTNDTIHPYSLQNISPCANMGMSDIADITLPPNDIAGNTRIFQDIIDIGAYELQETTETKPELELSETTFYFGEVEWGNSEERTLFIENNGNASLELDIFVKDTSDVFTIVKGLKQTKTDTLHFEIPPFGSESLIVTFTPSDDITSVYNGEIEFSSNDKDGSIALVGKGSGYPDLVISNITIPDPEVEIIAGTSIEVSWTIENIGNTETSVIGGWKDYVTLVKIIDSENIKRIITKDDDNISALRPGETYTNTSRFDIPITNEVEGIYRFDISTAMDCINFENRDNNDLSSSNFEIILPIPPNLEVVSFTATPNPIVADSLCNFTWSVENIGMGLPDNNSWYDALYLSTDSIIDISDDKLLIKSYYSKPDTNDFGLDSSYTVSESVRIPYNIIDTAYVYVFTDIENDVYEGNYEMNYSAIVDTLSVQFGGAPDIIPSIVKLPDYAFTGETIEVVWKDSNDLYARRNPFESICTDRLYISEYNNFFTDSSLVMSTITTDSIDMILEPGSSYTIRKEIKIPENIGFLPDTSYFKSYLFTSDIGRSNTLKRFGLNEKSINNNEMSDYELVKTTLANVQNTSKSDKLVLDCYVYLNADYNNKVFEHTGVDDSAENNNVATDSMKIRISPWADLMVDTLFTSSNSVKVGNYVNVSWIIKNQGDTLAYRPWTDKVYLSPTAEWEDKSSIMLKEIIHEYSFDFEPLGVGDSISQSRLCRIPQLSFDSPSKQYYIHVITDKYNHVYERDSEANNISAALPILVTQPVSPEVDLDPLDFNFPDSVLSGSKINVSWQVINNGPSTTKSGWIDAIHLGDIAIGSKLIGLELNSGSSYTSNTEISIPKNITGYSSIDLNIDNNENLNDIVRGNNIISENVYIKLRDPSDLKVTDITLPDSIQSGQPFDLIYSVTNQGIGVTDEITWYDGFYLSQGLEIFPHGILIGTNEREGSLQPGESYTDTVRVNLSSEIYGDLFLLAMADYKDEVYEHKTEDNNVKFKPVSVNLTNLVDLAVSDVSTPEELSLGDSISVGYTLSNLSENDANGWIRDAVYVSEDSIWSSDDLLVDFKDYEIELLAGQSEVVKSRIDLSQSYPTDEKGEPMQEDKGNISSILPGVSPGSYHIITKTNIRFSIRETIINNNTASSTNTFTVDVPDLALEMSKHDSLRREGINYYKVEIDSLFDESLQIILDGMVSKGSATFNEMYVKYGEVPTLSNYEYAYDNPYSPDQRILIPNTQIGTYYIMVKSNYQEVESQNISLYAKLVGFELHRIDQTVGGNSGEVTIKMTGSGFGYGVKPVLQQHDVNFIYAKETYFTDNTELYATFDLEGKNYGAYDVKLIKDMSRFEFTYRELYIDTLGLDTMIMVPDSAYIVPDSVVTVLDDAFTIESSNNRSYLENIDVPDAIRAGTGIFISSVEIINMSNNDMIAPLYMLKSKLESKLPGESRYTTGFKKFLVLAKDGPAGVIPPGHRAKVEIIAKSPKEGGRVTYNIMKIQESGFEFDFDRELTQNGFDKEDSEWTEIINQLEYEIGNSWEGYNKILSNNVTIIKKPSTSSVLQFLICLRKDVENYNSIEYDVNTSKFDLNLEHFTEIARKNYLSKSTKDGLYPYWIQYYMDLAMLTGSWLAFGLDNLDINDLGRVNNYSDDWFNYYFNPLASPPDFEAWEHSIKALIGDEEFQRSFFDVEKECDEIRDVYLKYLLAFNGCPDDIEDVDLCDTEYGNILSGIAPPSWRPTGNLWTDIPMVSGLGITSDLFYSFGNMQEISNAKMSNIRMVGEPYEDECIPGNMIYTYEGDIEYLFRDNYNYDDASIGNRDNPYSLLGACWRWENNYGIGRRFDTFLRVKRTFKMNFSTKL